jgi:hypothetical protein
VEAVEKQLLEVRNWAGAKIASGAEPPWAWYQYMKLIETVDAILGGMAITKGSSPQSAGSSDAHLRLVDPNDLQENTPHRPAGLPTQMPM